MAAAGAGADLARGVAASLHADVAVEHPARLVTRLLRRPESLDVIVLVGAGGETLARVAMEAAGGSARTPAIWIGPGIVAFGTAHGPALRLAAAPSVRADPTAAIRAGALLLDHLGAPDAAGRVRDAVERVLADPHRADATPSSIGNAVGRLLAAPGRTRLTTPPPAESHGRHPERLDAVLGSDAFWDWDLARDPFLDRLDEPGGGPPAAWAARVHPEDRPGIVEGLRRFLGGREMRWTAEYRVPRPDGSPAHVAVRAWVLRDGAGVPTRVLGVTVDVSERMELLARLQLADRLVSVGALVGSVAHGVNNPIQATLGGIENALVALDGQEGPGIAVARDALAHAAEGAARAGRAVRDLQAFAQPEGARIGPVDPSGPLERALGLARHELRHRGRVSLEVAPVSPVRADPHRLEQVFLNLLLQAARALPEGHAEAHQVRVVVRPAGATRVAVEVHDTGPGIPPERLERLFDPWAVADPSALSLAICREIVAEMGGEIQVETEEGRGTCFHVFLPVAPTPAPEPVPVTPVPAGEGASVLVVEDDEDVAEVIVRALHGRYRVVWVEDARVALARIASGERWDVILCDLMLPELNGVELHAELVRLAPGQAARMAFMSGGVFSGKGARALEGLDNPFLEKPFTMRQLRDLVGRLVGDPGRAPGGEHP